MVEKDMPIRQNEGCRPRSLTLAGDAILIGVPLAGLGFGVALGAYLARKEGKMIRRNIVGLRRTEEEILSRAHLPFPPEP